MVVRSTDDHSLSRRLENLSDKKWHYGIIFGSQTWQDATLLALLLMSILLLKFAHCLEDWLATVECHCKQVETWRVAMAALDGGRAQDSAGTSEKLFGGDFACEEDWDPSSEGGEALSEGEEESQPRDITTIAPACNLQPQMLIQQMGGHPIAAFLATILGSEAARELHKFLWKITWNVAGLVRSAVQLTRCDFVAAEASLKGQESEGDAASHPFATREDKRWASSDYRMAIVCGYALTGMHVDHVGILFILLSAAQVVIAACGYAWAWAFFWIPENAIISSFFGVFWVLSASAPACGWLRRLGASPFFV